MNDLTMRIAKCGWIFSNNTGKEYQKNDCIVKSIKKQDEFKDRKDECLPSLLVRRTQKYQLIEA